MSFPKWLEFDANDNVLYGIPTPGDAGQLYLEITAQGATSRATVTSTIFVRDVASHSASLPLRFKAEGPEFVQCKEKEPETVATIIVDADLVRLSVPEQIGLLRKFLSHMELHEGMVKMVPVGNSPMHDSSALVSGSGDAASPKTSGLFISWPVGCGQVKESHFPVLQRLDDDSSTGKMAKVLGHPVIGWQVTNSHFQAPTRRRRQVHATPTPAVTPVVATRTEIKHEKTDDAEEKMTHKLVDTPSPTFIQPTSTQPAMTKTEEPVVIPSVHHEDKPSKVMPAETTPKVTPVSKTKEMPAIQPSRTYEPSESTHVPTTDTDTCVPGRKPIVKTPLEKLIFHVGNVIDYVIPENTFEDCEVGGTRGLELMLFRNATDAIPPDFFLQFDAKEQKIIGLPMKDNVAKLKFNLYGRKRSNGLMASTDIEVHIRDAKSKKKINHKLSVIVDYDYDEFMANTTAKISLANRIASVYGDESTKHLTAIKIQAGSVAYSWTNSSLLSSGCPADEIEGLIKKLVSDDGTLTDGAVEKLKPFVLLGAKSEPAGSCETHPGFPALVGRRQEPTTPAEKEEEPVTTKKLVIEEPGGEEVEVDEDGEKTETSRPVDKPDTTTASDVVKGGTGRGGGDDDDDIWITTVVPAVVIVVILLIALLIACILYRKKRKGKMSMEEQNTFINKGAPVIFPDELEDKPSDVNKPLLVEGSPAPPPEYRRGASESPERLVGGSYRNNGSSRFISPADDGIGDLPEKPYEPPPPVTASNINKQPRATHQQQPYSQPPQILP